VNNEQITLDAELAAKLLRFERLSLILGIVTGVLCVVGAIFDREQFFRSYLVAFLFWLAIALGCLAVEMMQYLTGGRWGVVIERLLESAAGTLPFLAVAFVPLLFSFHTLYPWSRPELVAGDPVLRHKQPYMNVPFFLVRAILAFTIWITLAWLIQRRAANQYERNNYVAVRSASAIGLILYVFSISWAAIDWAQSLQPHWYSTMWGWLFVAQQGLSAMAFIIGAGILLSGDSQFGAAFSQDRLHDLGKLLLMFVMLWAYFSFAQFLIIWSGNLTEEIPWYLERMATSWGWAGTVLIVFQFCVPFLLLLSRSLKRSPRWMLPLVVFVLLMRLVDLFWIVMPDVYPDAFRLSWLDLAAPIALGSLWLFAFSRGIRMRGLIPVGDPRIEEVLQHAR